MKRAITGPRCAALTALLAVLPAPARAQVLRVAELNTEQIRALDRAKTAVILVGGILEEHGPYLPSYADGYDSERLARDVAEAIAARPGWAALLFPAIPLGQGGANVIGGHHSFLGSYNVRSSTLRAVYIDLADALGEQGFRWVFVVDGHGSPNHNRALDAAGDYFHDVHGGRMVHLFGFWSVRQCCEEPAQKLLGAAGLKENGFSVHAGAGEHSSLLFHRPDLVSAAVASAPSVTGESFADLVRLARSPGWAGYFGAPRLATAALGAQQFALERDALAALALRVLDGWDPTTERRYADVMAGDAAVHAVDVEADAEDARREARQREWLEKRKR